MVDVVDVVCDMWYPGIPFMLHEELATQLVDGVPHRLLLKEAQAMMALTMISFRGCQENGVPAQIGSWKMGCQVVDSLPWGAAKGAAKNEVPYFETKPDVYSSLRSLNEIQKSG